MVDTHELRNAIGLTYTLLQYAPISNSLVVYSGMTKVCGINRPSGYFTRRSCMYQPGWRVLAAAGDNVVDLVFITSVSNDTDTIKYQEYCRILKWYRSPFWMLHPVIQMNHCLMQMMYPSIVSRLLRSTQDQLSALEKLVAGGKGDHPVTRRRAPYVITSEKHFVRRQYN